MRPLTALLPLLATGCLANFEAPGFGPLLITEYAEFSATTDQVRYVEVTNYTNEVVTGGTFGIYIHSEGVSALLPDDIAAGESYVVELEETDFQQVFSRSADLTLRDDMPFPPDEITLYLADGSGFEATATGRRDATVQDVVDRSAGPDGNDMNNVILCRRPSVTRGRGNPDGTEWTATETLTLMGNGAVEFATPGSWTCP